jgi:carboxyl-terminal processing protease
VTVLAAVLLLAAGAAASPDAKPAPSVLAEIDARVRAEFWDPKLKGVDWGAAVTRAGGELSQAKTESERDAIYDRLLGALRDSHTFRIPASRLPPAEFASPGLRIGRDADGWAVKGVLPGSPAEKEGMALGARVLAIDGRPYGTTTAPTDLRGLFLDLQGRPGTSVAVKWAPSGASSPRVSNLTRVSEPPGDAQVWGGARILRKDGHAYGYIRLWGTSTETTLMVVDLLADRVEIARRRPDLAGWDAIEGVLLDLRGNVGGYDSGILTTLFSGGWTAGSFVEIERGTRRVLPARYVPLPAAVLVNSGTASAGELFAAKFRAAGLGPVVGETTAGMGSGGASITSLPDGSQLWITRRAFEDLSGRSYEGKGLVPDVAVADRPAAESGREQPVVEAALAALEAKRKAGAPPLR